MEEDLDQLDFEIEETKTKEETQEISEKKQQKAEWAIEQQKLIAIIEQNSSKKFDVSKLKMIGVVKLIKDTQSNDAIAVLIVLTYPEMKIQYQDFEKITITEKKIFSFRSFQHAPHLIKLIKKLESSPFYPQLIIAPGSGIQSIGIGLAQHIGSALNIPSFSVKTDYNDKCNKDGINYVIIQSMQFFKYYQVELKEKAVALKEGGDYICITGLSGQKYGIIYKSTNNKSDLPIIVAVGNSIDFESIITILKRVCKYKNVLPEPLRIIQEAAFKLFKSQIQQKKKEK